MLPSSTAPEAAVIGGGPAGLIAAEVLARAGVRVTVYDRMPSVGRKLLMAGRGGLNLTHSEEIERFVRHLFNTYEAVDAIAFGAIQANAARLFQSSLFFSR